MNTAARPEGLPPYLNIRQVAAYLQLNEKKVYALASEGQIPATKVTGKWLFPRDLVDRWLLESAHGGVLHDRLVIAGSDDPLLHRLVSRLAAQLGGRALVSYTGTGSRQGLELLAGGRAEVAAIHWGPAEESHFRHPALVSRHPQHRNWMMIHAFRRETGLVVGPPELAEASVEELLRGQPSWVLRPQGTGSRRLLEELLQQYRIEASRLKTAAVARSERELGSLILRGEGQLGPGCHATAAEFGLSFIPCTTESFDLVLPRGVFFRDLFKALMRLLEEPGMVAEAAALGGYDLSDCGKLLWTS